MNIRQILVPFAVLLWVSGCSDSTVTNPAIQSDQVESSGTLPSIVFKYKVAAQIVDPAQGTFYQCGSGEIYAATGGEYLYSDCQVWNDKERYYTLEVKGPHRYVLSEAATVEISNPVGVYYRTDGGQWIGVTGDTTVTCDVVRVRGGGSADLSTSARIEIHSGRSEN